MASYYVDPAIAGNSGTGTVGDPFGDLQYALDTITRDTASGDQVNIKAGTAEILAASLSLTTYGTPDTDAPIVFRGYTSVTEDGGVGVINGDALYGMIAGSPSNVHFINMELYNSGSTPLLIIGANCSVINCELHTCTYNTWAINIGTRSLLMDSYIHTLTSGNGLLFASYCQIVGNFIDHSDKWGIYVNGASCTVFGNIIKMNTTNAAGINNPSQNQIISGNTIYNSTAGTAEGIYCGANDYHSTIINNIIEGWSGAGGKAISILIGAGPAIVISNQYFNNTTNEDFTETILHRDNVALVASAFNNPATNDFTVTVAVKGVATPQYIGGPQITLTPNFLDAGAAQREELAGGGLMKIGQGGGYNG